MVLSCIEKDKHNLTISSQVHKCISRLARRKSHHTALRYAGAPNSECPCHAAQFRLHPGSNAAAVTPREPKFTKMGEDLSE